MKNNLLEFLKLKNVELVPYEENMTTPTIEKKIEADCMNWIRANRPDLKPYSPMMIYKAAAIPLQRENHNLKIELEAARLVSECATRARDEADVRWLKYGKENKELREALEIQHELMREKNKELDQQRFNNQHNLSIDQKVSDEIQGLREALDWATGLISLSLDEFSDNAEFYRQKFKLDEVKP